MPPFCPNCGADTGNARFCPNCGSLQGNQPVQPSPQPSVYAQGSGRPKYDEMICFLICCCLTPLGAVLYYLFTEHEENY